MKKIALLLILCFIACNFKEEKKITSKANEYSELDWLLGNWIRTNEKEDRETYESWIKINEQEYEGISFTIKNKDTIWQENVSLKQNKGNWSFVVLPKGEVNKTIFKVTKFDSITLICENQENEFPKIIKYFKDGNKIKATIEGGELKIPFEFEKSTSKK